MHDHDLCMCMIMTSACAALHRKSEQGIFDMTTHRDIKTKAAHLTHRHVETNSKDA